MLKGRGGVEDIMKEKNIYFRKNIQNEYDQKSIAKRCKTTSTLNDHIKMKHYHEETQKDSKEIKSDHEVMPQA